MVPVGMGPPPAIGQAGRVPPPFQLCYDCEEVAVGLWPSIGSETKLARWWLALSPRWEIHQAVNEKMNLGTANRLVAAMELLPYEDLLQQGNKQKEIDQAKKALRSLTKPDNCRRAR